MNLILKLTYLLWLFSPLDLSGMGTLRQCKRSMLKISSPRFPLHLNWGQNRGHCHWTPTQCFVQNKLWVFLSSLTHKQKGIHNITDCGSDVMAIRPKSEWGIECAPAHVSFPGNHVVFHQDWSEYKFKLTVTKSHLIPWLQLNA